MSRHIPLVTLALLALVALLDPFPNALANMNSSGNQLVVPAPGLPGHGVPLALDGGALTIVIGSKRCAWVSCSSGCTLVGAVGYSDGGSSSPAVATDLPIASTAVVHTCAIGTQDSVSCYSATPSVCTVAVEPQ